VDPVANAGPSDGVNIPGTVGDVDGDITGRDKTVQRNKTVQNVNLPYDQSSQEVVRLLEKVLEELRHEKNSLLEENKNLIALKMAIDGAFAMVKMAIGVQSLSVSEYIWLTYRFISNEKLEEQFCRSFPPGMLKAAKENG
jgi:hypothetical protein